MRNYEHHEKFVILCAASALTIIFTALGTAFVPVSAQSLPGTVDIKVNGGYDPITVPYGTEVELTWSNTNPDWTECKIYNSEQLQEGGRGPNLERLLGAGQTRVKLLEIGKYRFYAVCNKPGYGAAGINSNLPAYVNVTPTALPTLDVTVSSNDAGASITPSSASVNSGSDVTVAWNATNADLGCYSSLWNQAKGAVSGQVVIKNVTAKNSYQITCKGSGGSAGEATKSVAVDIRVSANLKVDGKDGPVTVTEGTSPYLSWTSSDPAGTGACTVSSDGKVVATGGASANWQAWQAPSGVTKTVVLTLDCATQSGQAKNQFSVTVNVVSKVLISVGGAAKVEGPKGQVLDCFSVGGKILLKLEGTAGFSCTISGDNGGTPITNVLSNSQHNWEPPTGLSAIKAVCTNAAGESITDSVVVTVNRALPGTCLGEGGPMMGYHTSGKPVAKIISPANNSPVGPITFIMRGYGGNLNTVSTTYDKWTSTDFVLDGTSIGPSDVAQYRCDKNGKDIHDNSMAGSSEYWCASRTVDLTDMPYGNHAMRARGNGVLSQFADDTTTLTHVAPGQSNITPSVTVTKVSLLKILNDALADGVLDASEKIGLLSALNTYLSGGSTTVVVKPLPTPVNRDTATESFRRACTVQDTVGYAGLIGSCQTSYGGWTFVKYRRVGCTTDLGLINGQIVCQPGGGSSGGGGTCTSNKGTLSLQINSRAYIVVDGYKLTGGHYSFDAGRYGCYGYGNTGKYHSCNSITIRPCQTWKQVIQWDP